MLHFNYNFNRDDYRYLISEKNSQYNIIYFIIATIVYLLFMYQLLIDKPFDISFLYIVYILIIKGLIKLYNMLSISINIRKNDLKMLYPYGKYKAIIDDVGISITFLKQEKKVTWDQVSNVRINEKYIMLYINDGNLLFFRQEYFKKKEHYEKLITIIQRKTRF
ncbi:MAG: hypothetical protein PHO63_05065 [Bacilli bacterium]|nr:hypothetical protein [Bacilli bacterium]MDD4809129.1 hypothetical protein [Bacilli bacterium]